MNLVQELALAYVKEQGIKDLTPTEFYDKFYKVEQEISKRGKEYCTGVTVLK